MAFDQLWYHFLGSKFRIVLRLPSALLLLNKVTVYFSDQVQMQA